MVSECANPGCNEKFKYLGEGKLFLSNPMQGLQMSQQQLFEQCSWLCKNCSKHYRVEFGQGSPQLVSLSFKKAANL
jgi:hypothetical protein